MSTATASSAEPAQQPAAAKPLFCEKTLDRHVWHLAVPAIAENLLATTLLVVDTLMIARFHTVAIAASAVAGCVIWRTHMTLGCIEKGTIAMVARFFGEGDRDKVARTVAQSIYLAIGVGSLVTVVGVVLSRSFLQWMGSSPEVVEAGTPFLAVLMAASVPRMLLFVASASLRGCGDTRSPMWITLGLNVVNLFLNYALIFGHFGFPRLGLLGSALSTACSITVGCVGIAWVMTRGSAPFCLKLHHFRPSLRTMRAIVRISAANFFEEIIISVGFLIFYSYIARMGTDVLAAHRITSTIESLSYMAGVGFAISAATLVGQSLGMKRPDLAHRCFRRTTGHCALVMTAIAAALILFGAYMIEAFKPEENVRDMARILLLIAAIEQPLLGISMTLSGGIRGAGDTLSPMICALAGCILVRVVLVYWLSFTLGWGIYGVYIGTMIDWAVRSSMLWYFYWRGRWLRVRVG